MASGMWHRTELSVREDSAAGRVEAWGNGIAMWKTSPLWGVGFGQFGDHNQDQGGLTAHNSFVLCFAELGTLGYLLWLSLIAATMWELSSMLDTLDADDPDKQELIRCATAVRLSLIAYLATAWFLSRTYEMTLYVLLGMGVALVEMANRQIEPEIRIATGRLVRWSTVAALASIVFLYCTLWTRAA
jgi:O-antigen ligase